MVESPGQNPKSPEIEIVNGGALKVEVFAVPMQPWASVTVINTVSAGPTKIVCDVSPEDHEYVLYVPASSSVESPGQTLKLPLIPGEIDDVLNVMTEADVPAQPLPSVTITE
jgi:hypothetical protein